MFLLGTHPLAGLVDLGNVHVGEGLDELGRVEQVVGPPRRQDLILLLDLCWLVGGGWWVGGWRGRVSGGTWAWFVGGWMAGSGRLGVMRALLSSLLSILIPYREVGPGVGGVDVLLVQGQDLVVRDGAGVREVVHAWGVEGTGMVCQDQVRSC